MQTFKLQLSTMSTKEENGADKATEQNRNDEGIFSKKVVGILMIIYLSVIILGGLAYHFMEAPHEQTDFNSSVAKLTSFLGE